jgi:hypothetical protein
MANPRHIGAMLFRPRPLCPRTKQVSDEAALIPCVTGQLALKHWDRLSLCLVRLGRTVVGAAGHTLHYIYFDKYLGAVQGQYTSIRDVTSKGLKV